MDVRCAPIEIPCPCSPPCGWKHYRPGPVVDYAPFHVLAAECPRKESVEMHGNGQYAHVLMGGDVACSGAYLAAKMVREGSWSYARSQLAAFVAKAEIRRAAFHVLPMPEGPCACGGTCPLCRDCPTCYTPDMKAPSAGQDSGERGEQRVELDALPKESCDGGEDDR